MGNISRPDNIQLPTSLNTGGGSVRLTVTGNLALASVLSTAGGDFIINSPGIVTLSAPVQTGGGVINVTGSAISATGVDLSSSNPEGPGGNIDLTARSGSIATGNLSSSALTVGAAGNVTLSALEGGINVGNIQATAIGGGPGVSGPGGTITLTAIGNVTTGQIDVRGAPGGMIGLTSRGGSINVTGDPVSALNTSGIDGGGGGAISLTASNAIDIANGAGDGGNVNSSGVSGGAVFLNAVTTIAAGEITANGSVGDGGNVTIDPTGDVQITSITAQGGPGGTGGVVDITTERFFRASGGTSTVPSISTAGGLGGGSITIRHGGSGQTPFIVGDATENGTAAAITSGDSTLAPERQFFFTFTEGNIGIVSVDEPPTSVVDPPIPPEPPETVPGLEDLPLPLPEVEERFTTTFENYLGMEKTRIKTLEEVREMLRLVEEQATGVKPVVIYAVFIPTQAAPTSGAVQEERLELIVVTSKGLPFRLEQERPDRNRVEETIAKFQGQIGDPTSSADLYLPLAQQLYQWLVTPLVKLQQAYALEINHLIFVLDSSLRSLPVAALHDGEAFLIEKYSIGLMPSLSLTDLRYVSIKDLGVLAMGAEQFSGQDPLPGGAIELENILALWPGKRLFNTEFTKRNVLDSRSDRPFGILHFATHAGFVGGDFSNSYLQLWDDRLKAYARTGVKVVQSPRGAAHLECLSDCCRERRSRARLYRVCHQSRGQVRPGKLVEGERYSNGGSHDQLLCQAGENAHENQGGGFGTSPAITAHR